MAPGPGAAGRWETMGNSIVGGDCPNLHGRPCTKMRMRALECQDSGREGPGGDSDRFDGEAAEGTPAGSRREWPGGGSGLPQFPRASSSAASMVRLKDSSGWAPYTTRPLMKKAGVPLTP